MQSLFLHTRVGKDGILKIEMPIGITNTDLDIVLVVNPVEEKQALNWSPDFFTEVIGGWQGEPLVREPQGKYETRDELK
jgi:hypothetical protein